MKTFGCLFFILATITPYWVVQLSLMAKKEIVRREVKHRLMESEPEEVYVHFAFSKVETETLLRWEHSKEFEYEGEMYDVVRAETRNDSVFYTLWWDHEETEINQKLARLTKEQHSRTPQKERLIVDVFKVHFQDLTIPIPQLILNKSEHTLSLKSLSPSISLPVEPPPPELGISA